MLHGALYGESISAQFIELFVIIVKNTVYGSTIGLLVLKLITKLGFQYLFHQT